MGLKAKLIAKIWEELQKRINKYSDFIKPPMGLDAVKAAAKKALEEVADQLLKLLEDNLAMLIALGADLVLQQVFGAIGSDNANDSRTNQSGTGTTTIADRTMEEKAVEYVKKHPGIRALNNLIDQDYTDSAVGLITQACTDPDLYETNLRDLMSNLNIPNNSVNSEDFINNIGLQSSSSGSQSGTAGIHAGNDRRRG